ncbi:hypothetical protein Hanom_Chr17g01536391 [Helianthus anomalus]
MSSTIFPSLTTFFGGHGHHSPLHPTISPNQQFLSQNLAITPLNFKRVRVGILKVQRVELCFTEK